jgi:hypothetical protein
MEPKYLYTIKWTQPYATDWQRPYLRGLQQQMEQVIEKILEQGEYNEAKEVIERIKRLG